MTLEDIETLVNRISAYPARGIRTTPSHVFVTMGRKMPRGRIIDLIFAVDRRALREANNPEDLFAEQVKVSDAELAGLPDDHDTPLPIWGE